MPSELRDDIISVGLVIVLAVCLIATLQWLSGPPWMSSFGEGVGYRDNRRMEESHRFKSRDEVTGWDTEQEWTRWDSRSGKVRG